jgi:D-xylulose reductase
MVEPFAIGMQAALRARIKPGDVAAVTGCGPIGIMVALAALAGGCARVYISDLVAEKLAIAGGYAGIIPVNVRERDFAETIRHETDGWGADVVFEASGAPKVYDTLFDVVCPGGCVVFVGMPVDPVPFNIVAAQAREIRMETVFRYANIYDRAINLIASGKVDLKPLVSRTFAFEQSVAAFERAAEAHPTDVKIQIAFEDA